MQKPSKTFIIRASVISGFLLLVLLSQTNWAKRLFNKDKNNTDAATTTVGEVVGKDSNGNGIPDWEERLWGLDPTVLYTEGVSNKEIIEQKKRSLGLTGTDSTVNETDKLARELFSLTTALGQSGNADAETLKKIGEKLGESTDTKQITNHYSYKDIHPTSTTRKSLTEYHSNVMKIVASFDQSSADMNTVINSLEAGDFSAIGQLDTTQTQYRQVAGQLAALRVPLGVAGYHLSIINGLYGMSDAFGYLKQIDDNAVQGITGITIYKTFALQYQTAVNDLSDYLTQYGIL
jgi:hypothetical protein